MTLVKQIGDYYITSAGNVWREHGNEFYLRLRPNKQGLVKLYTNGERKDMKVYRLVAMAFVPVPEKYQGMSIDELEVHHINFNHNDNRASNLQWLTKTEHMQLHSDSEVTSLRKSDAKKGKPRPEGAGTPPKFVAQYTKYGAFVAKYKSLIEAARETGILKQNISSVCIGKRNSAGGFKWAYLN